MLRLSKWRSGFSSQRSPRPADPRAFRARCALPPSSANSLSWRKLTTHSGRDRICPIDTPLFQMQILSSVSVARRLAQRRPRLVRCTCADSGQLVRARSKRTVGRKAGQLSPAIPGLFRICFLDCEDAGILLARSRLHLYALLGSVRLSIRRTPSLHCRAASGSSFAAPSRRTFRRLRSLTCSPQCLLPPPLLLPSRLCPAAARSERRYADCIHRTLSLSLSLALSLFLCSPAPGEST